MLASSSGVNSIEAHQQAACAVSLVLTVSGAEAIAQRLGWPHSGHSLGSGGISACAGIGAFMAKRA
jgi:hypothetical protein